jgi:tetratricopeptide (TPR) repeat protein
MTLERGDAIGRFVVLAPLGAGGMGEVYAAYDPDLDRKVAVKLLGAKLSESAHGASLLLREAQAAAKLQHPNVVVVYDVGTFHERVFIAMELVDGETVGAWLASHRPSWREVLDVFVAAGHGLAAAHAANLVHRDFKPDNVMITRDGQVRVMDFGLARSIDAEEASAPAGPEGPTPTMPFLQAHLTRTGAHVGTPAYMAPEQFLPGGEIDARTDQFNFCVALYEALYGERPFGNGELGLTQLRAAAGKVQPAPAGSHAPQWVRRALLRGLRPARDERWPSINELLAALRNDPAVRRRRWLAVAAGASLIVAASLAVRVIGGGRAAPLCSSGASRLAGIWEPAGATSARREEIHRAFLASGASFAEQAFTGVSRLLDEFASRWIASYGDACQATHVRHEQSVDALDLRMGCLGERLGNLHALTDVLAHADGSVVENAVSAAGALPNLDRCSDIVALRAVVAPPQDPAKRREVAHVREELARFVALRDSGQCKAAAASADRVVAAADATGYGPLRAEAYVAAGHLGDACGSIALGLSRLKAGYAAAYAAKDDRSAVIAATLVPEFLERLGQADQAVDWIGFGKAALERLGGDGGLESWLLQAEGDLKRTQRDYPGAIADLRSSIEIKRRLLGPDHPDLVHALLTLGNVLEAAARYDQALAVDSDAMTLATKVFGSDHPLVAMISMNTGEVLNDLHRHVEAQHAFEAALKIWRRSGADGSFVAFGLTGLGRARLGELQPDAAIAPLEQALAIRLDKHAAADLIGETRFALAQALWVHGDARARALALAEAARADRASDPPAVAQIDAWLIEARPGHGHPGARPSLATNGGAEKGHLTGL